MVATARCVARPFAWSTWFRGMLGFCVMAVASSVVSAQIHRDIQIIPMNGRVVTGVADFNAPGTPFTSGVRLFTAAFGEAPNGTDDPGFSASTGAFTTGTLIAFDILDALRKWDGADFDAVPAERLFIGLGANNRQTPTVANSLVSGFNIVQAGSTGGFHQHINYFLLSPATTGVYMLKFQLRATGFAASDPLYVVFSQNAPASDVNAALAYVQNVLLAPPLCMGDADADRAVTFADITSVLVNFGVQGAPGTTGDADGSGVVNFADVTSVLTNFGNTCP